MKELKPGKFAPRITEEHAKDNAFILKSIADPARIQILNMLLEHEGKVCVFEIVEEFKLEQPTISHHLTKMLATGVVSKEKKGMHAYYYINREILGMTILDLITRSV